MCFLPQIYHSRLGGKINFWLLGNSHLARFLFWLHFGRWEQAIKILTNFLSWTILPFQKSRQGKAKESFMYLDCIIRCHFMVAAHKSIKVLVLPSLGIFRVKYLLAFTHNFTNFHHLSSSSSPSDSSRAVAVCAWRIALGTRRGAFSYT